MEIQGTKLRALSAIAAVIILFGSWWIWSATGVLWVTFVIVGAAQIEFRSMYLVQRLGRAASWGFVVVAFSTLVSMVLLPDWGVQIFGLLSVMLMILGLSSASQSKDLTKAVEATSLLALGILYCGFLPSFALSLLRSDETFLYFLWVITVAFAGDIAAYFVGLKFGKHRLWELVSPKKSREGSIGGLVASMIIGFLWGWFVFTDVPLAMVVAVSAIMGILGQLGDLFESMLKRVAGVKDSGSLMPGHGGLMDRIDSVILAGPVAVLFVLWVLENLN
jgi:phosphatidate cytidylyltransferase